MPTSSSVMYLPLSESTNSPNFLINSGVLSVFASPIITAFPPPRSKPATALLKVMPRERRSTSLSASHSLLYFHMRVRSEEHTSELQSRPHLVCRLLLEKKKNKHQ